MTTLALVAGLIALAGFSIWLAVSAARSEGASDARNIESDEERQAREAFEEARDRMRLSGGALVRRLREIAERRRRPQLPGNDPGGD